MRHGQGCKVPRKKFEAFGCEVISIDGHDFDALESAFEKFHATQDKPTVILLQTVKGKGVSYMENVAGWHGTAPNDEQFAAAMAELGKEYDECRGGRIQLEV